MCPTHRLNVPPREVRWDRRPGSGEVGLGVCVRWRAAVAHGGADLVMAQEEGALVELLATEPAGDLVVALAGVARPAGRCDVVERVAPAAREGEHAVALQGSGRGAAVGAAAPGVLEGGPLLVAEVVVHPGHPALALAGAARLATPVDRHRGQARQRRSEERRVGKACVSTVRARWAP